MTAWWQNVWASPICFYKKQFPAFDNSIFFFQVTVHFDHFLWKVLKSLLYKLCLNLFIASRIFHSWMIWKMKKWYFVTKIVLTYCEKQLYYWSRKTFESRGRKLRIFKNFDITRTIYSNSERSEQFLVTECFFNLFLEVSQI